MIKKVIVRTFVYGFIALTSPMLPMENENLLKFSIENEKELNKNKDKKKKQHAHILKELKLNNQKKELDEIYISCVCELGKKFDKYEKNNLPYDDLVKNFYRLLCQHEDFSGPIKTDPEKLLIVGLTYPEVPDFILHAIMAYVGFHYTEKLAESKNINNPLGNGKNTNQQFTIPWPQKKFRFKIPDNIDGKPIFSPDGSQLAVLGTKCITVFNTVTGQKMCQCKRLLDRIQLLQFGIKQKSSSTNIVVKTDGGIFIYELNETCTSSDGIPNMFLIERENKLDALNELTKIKSSIKNDSITTSKSISPKKKNSLIYTSLPQVLSTGSFLPPYTDRFGVVKRSNKSLAFVDLDLNTLFPSEKNEELSLEKTDNILKTQMSYIPFGLVSENGLYGVISETQKTLDLYGFTAILPANKWLLTFCLRYGQYKKPLNTTSAWCKAAYDSFNEDEQEYLKNNYSFTRPKKNSSLPKMPSQPSILVVKEGGSILNDDKNGRRFSK